MPTPNKPSKRLTLDVTEEVYERMIALKVTSNAASTAEMLRNALTIYDHLVSEVKHKGGTLVIHYPDKREKELLLPGIG